MRHASPAAAVVAAALVASLLAACGTESPPVARTRASAANIEAHVRFLADDLLEGREAGTRGYDLAALYATAQFRLLGLEPAGDDGGYLQKVPLVSGSRVLEGARFSYVRDGKRTELKPLVDWMPSVNYNAEQSEVTAPLVFVGQAVHAPELGHDDLAGVDLKGKIAVYFGGAPARFGNTERAVSSSNREKSATLVARGAVGAIYLSTPKEEERYSWERYTKGWQRAGMRLRGPDGKGVDTFPELKAGASLSVVQARRLFEGAPASFDEVVARIEKGEAKPFDMPVTATIAVRSRFEQKVSHNVAARLPGSDPALAAEHVVFTAHLDHVGIKAVDPEKPDADRLNNGATDNALGTGILLEVARNLAGGTVKPKRSALFVLVTAEEKGLLGAEYFAAFPTVPADGIVANVNMDMPVMMTELTDVIPFGLHHSSLQHVLERAVREVVVTISPDPIPEESIFVRSDQYAFVRKGIPAVYLDAGIVAKDPAVDGKKLLDEFLEKHYHQPSDDLSQPIHWPTAARLADLNLRIGLMIANDPQRPTWNEGDWLGNKFGKR
jgi:hypothetical protein